MLGFLYFIVWIDIFLKLLLIQMELHVILLMKMEHFGFIKVKSMVLMIG